MILTNNTSAAGIKNIIQGYSTTVTNGGDLTLTFRSDNIQYLTGTNTHNVILPLASTLVIGQEFTIINASSQDILIKSSGLNTVCNVHTHNTVKIRCVFTSGIDASSWNYNVSTDSTASYFAAYDNGVLNTDINTTWTDIMWSSTDIIDTNFVFTPGTSSIQVTRAGDYEINVDLSMFVVSGSGSSKTQVELRILKNGVYLTGTKSLNSVQDVGIGTTMNIKLIKPLNINDTIKVQCIKQGTNRLVRLYPDGSRIVMQRLNK